MERRRFLQVAGAAVTGTFTGCQQVLREKTAEASPAPEKTAEASPAPEKTTEASTAPERTPRRFTRSEADTAIADADALLEALDSADRGNIVFVEGGASIDLTDQEEITIPGGVTLASNRGVGGAPGGELFTNGAPRPLFVTGGDGVRLVGLRLRGQKHEGFYDPNAESVYGYDSEGFRSKHAGTTIENCEFTRWTYSGVSTFGSDERVRDCAIYDNAMRGLGYGVMVASGTVIVENNYFNFNRHSVASPGKKDQSYICRYNLQGPKTTAHMFDVHSPGGKEFHFHNNRFQTAKTIRGKPTEAILLRNASENETTIHDNVFAHANRPGDRPADGQAINQTNTDGEWMNVKFWSNQYGSKTAGQDGNNWTCPPSPTCPRTVKK